MKKNKISTLVDQRLTGTVLAQATHLVDDGVLAVTPDHFFNLLEEIFPEVEEGTDGFSALIAEVSLRIGLSA